MKRTLYILALIAILATGARAQETNRVVIGGQYYYVHTVQPGETLYSISRKYEVPQDDISRNNPQIAEGLRAGEAIKIPAPEPDPLPRNIRNRTSSNRRVEVHTVNQGETAYSISKRYEVAVDDLINSNPGLDPTKLSIGQRILIPREVIGTSTQSEIDAGYSQYTESLSEVTDGWDYHLVERGETLYSLTRRLGISEDSLRRLNPTELAGGLKAGSMLKYPAEPRRPTGPAPVIDQPETPDTPVTYEDRDSKPFDTLSPLQVALLMPFTANGGAEAASTDYYNGTLMALQDIKNSGVSVNFSVYDTKRSAQEVRRILRSNDMDNVDLIIGPRTDEAFEEASQFAYRQRIPIVSPQMLVDTDNPFVFQVRPAPEYQYEKLRPFLTPDHNVVLLIPNSGKDEEFITAIEKLMPGDAKRITSAESVSSGTIQNALSRERENILIIPTDNENAADKILAKISTIQNSVSSRSGKGYPVRVAGSSQWARFRNIDKEYFFKLQVMYVTLYHADRTNSSIASFDQRYLSAFGTLPSLFSYRGYDVAKLFISAIHEYGDRYAQSINRVNPGLLQVPYHFRKDGSGKWINDEWVLVRYRDDYIIEVR